MKPPEKDDIHGWVLYLALAAFVIVAIIIFASAWIA